ncbi:MAG TPA: tRNA (adenosine(37)-N6)-threonylcarbamoyltransferase complex dimerization subunit type 1 TsaB [Xanthomonadales bacterium]|nr:tRNA (adenosine(37)-N6)-threonylcarbamoyltransferase complex dimerization subunit type 1 TsaB [Xanthomonadales bacterium]
MKTIKNILVIDTSSNKEVVVGVEINGKEFTKKQILDHHKAQAVLPMAEKLLKDHKLTLKDLTEIKVNPGPGSFTGLRVGVSIANALGFLLKIPVNGGGIGEIVEPVYS